ncbi:acyclic terpene utilization AtuA family protein [Halalkalicoccus sp. NIPERK01]|uniref:acyclic terpene utilization AtuA family protein n=1 Tax=Halalkalicoccus sp. NIPERK01 TaxID=3053469 RepID=UPI00256EBE8C|nr:acyclic terpene utilization AtuA family protein [Halalkalicoccus sp. NIPERK01]MDL5362070.1 acyclic terpene utilization AtuA family protein [Halalkalicoccus sp. NIPERK01]
MVSTQTIRLGAGAGYGGDRIEPAVQLARNGELDYLIFEGLAERTTALAQMEKLEDTDRGYNSLLEERFHAVLPHCAENGTRIVTNMGAANVPAAVEKTTQIVSELDLELSVAGVVGCDVVDEFDHFEEESFDGESISEYRSSAVSANAYIGCGRIVDALAKGADIVVTGRVADVSLYLGPLLHEFDWKRDADHEKYLGQGIVLGHLMECAGQITGGYFADPGYKDIDGLDELGFPIAEASPSGDVRITKLPETGGEVSIRTCKEQLLYEIHDPSRYITPDGIADFTGVSFTQEEEDVVTVTGAVAAPPPETLKVNIGYVESYQGEGQISYAGPGAEERAELAADIVQSRLESRDIELREIRIDLIGRDSLHGEIGVDHSESPYEVRVRVAGKCSTRDEAKWIGREVQTLYTNGPAGGGGATMNTSQIVGIVSTTIPRERVAPKIIGDST